MKTGLERLVGHERYEKLRADPNYAAAVDSFGMNSYSLIAAGSLDIASGRTLLGVATNRANGLWLNTLTARPYNKFRDFLYSVTKTTSDSGKLRRAALDFVIFNTFQTPLYLAINMGGAVAEQLAKGNLNVENAFHSALKGAEMLAATSIAIGPTLGMWQSVVRKFCGLETSGELSKKQNEN